MSLAQAGEQTLIDEIADRFERDWKHGEHQPRIEDYLAGQFGGRRAMLLGELIRVECELRRGAGESPTPAEYHQRFPDDRAAVDAAFGIAGEAPASPGRPAVSAAESLLFGLLALQNNFIDRDALLAAFNAWVADKSKSLGQLLLERNALSPARHALLAELVREHLQQHGQDPERSLAVLSIVPSVRDGLEGLPDLDLQASLLYLRLVTDVAGDDSDSERTASWDEESAATDTEGRFRIVRFHDRGALGEVYVARDQQLHRIVALKRIQSGHAVDREKCARFVVEAEITGRLEHPGIVPVYGLGTYDDGRPFYAMRFIRGDNLKSAIEQFHRDEEKGRDPGERAVALLKLLRRYLDVCNAIDYAHSRGVLHRDLKPGNIMLGKFGETLVVDWGLAKSMGRPDPAPASATMDERTLIPQSGSDLRGTELGARLGTPAYMSPEQAAGRIGDLGPASDVYSLGATLYCLLTGRAPFADPDLAELLRKVERGDFAPPRQLKGWVDPALEAICLKAMSTEPARRYRTPRALADDVEHWLADEPVSAWREPIRRRLRRWGRRHRLLVTGLAATLIVAVAALAVGNVLVARQRDIAERNLAFARTVVDEMYTQVAEKLDDEEQMDDYQREILEKALGFYERFALPQSRDPQVRLEAGRAGLRVGAIRSRLGNIAAAEQADRQALEVLSRLAVDQPVEPVYRDALAQAHRELAEILEREERWREAEGEIQQSLALWDALARKTPEGAEYRSKLAGCHFSLGRLNRNQSRDEKTEAEYRLALDAAEGLVREEPGAITYQELLSSILGGYVEFQSHLNNLAGSEASSVRAVAIAESLARDHPEVSRYQRRLGYSLDRLGHTYAQERKFPDAEQALERSIAILERLAADHPQDIEIATELGGTYGVMVDTLLLQGRFQSGLEWSGRTAPLLRSLARRDPRNYRASRTRLWEFLAARAETLMRLGRNAEALADFEEILELVRGTMYGDLFGAFHALTRARLGDLSAPALPGDQVRETLRLGLKQKSIYTGYYMLYYDAACIHCALAKRALEDRGRPPAERRRLAEQDIGRALDLLDKARAIGEFQKMIRLDEVRMETLLDPLRANPRFQLLMMDLEFPDDPFRP
ncbi:MAG: protein kinase domain-containing protein [Isosphaeraceae bacterium]